MKLRNYLLILFLLFFSSLRCRKEKEEQQLPAETQTRAGIVGFKANGTIYKSNDQLKLFHEKVPI